MLCVQRTVLNYQIYALYVNCPSLTLIYPGGGSGGVDFCEADFADAIKSVCKMLLILARLNACESKGSTLLTIRSGKTFNEQTRRYAPAGGLPIPVTRVSNRYAEVQV